MRPAMRTLAAAMILGAGLALPASALAQTKPAPSAAAPDPDVICFLALGEAMVILEEHPEILTDANRKYGNQVQQGVGYYSARVLLRFPGDQLDGAIYVASKAYVDMTKDQKKQTMVDCLANMGPEMRKLATGLRAASAKLQQERN
jgi:hypothetical protein